MSAVSSSSGLPSDLAYMVEYASRWKGPKFAERVLSGEYFARFEIPAEHAWTMPFLKAMAQPMPDALCSLEAALNSAPQEAGRYALRTFVTERMEEFVLPPLDAAITAAVERLIERGGTSGFDPVVGAILLSALSWSRDSERVEAVLIRTIDRVAASLPFTDAAHLLGDMMLMLTLGSASALRGMPTAHAKLRLILDELRASSRPIGGSETDEAREEALELLQRFVEKMK